MPQVRVPRRSRSAASPEHPARVSPPRITAAPAVDRRAYRAHSAVAPGRASPATPDVRPRKRHRTVPVTARRVTRRCRRPPAASRQHARPRRPAPPSRATAWPTVAPLRCPADHPAPPEIGCTDHRPTVRARRDARRRLATRAASPAGPATGDPSPVQTIRSSHGSMHRRAAGRPRQLATEALRRSVITGSGGTRRGPRCSPATALAAGSCSNYRAVRTTGRALQTGRPSLAAPGKGRPGHRVDLSRG